MQHGRGGAERGEEHDPANRLPLHLKHKQGEINRRRRCKTQTRGYKTQTRGQKHKQGDIKQKQKTPKTQSNVLQSQAGVNYLISCPVPKIRR